MDAPGPLSFTFLVFCRFFCALKALRKENEPCAALLATRLFWGLKLFYIAGGLITSVFFSFLRSQLLGSFQSKSVAFPASLDNKDGRHWAWIS